MGMIKNEHGVTINEVTVSHRATENSPHDAVTWDPGQGIRGVNIGGKVWLAGQDTVIRSVNISFDGVSVDCDTDFLMMLADREFRAALVERVKAEHADKEKRAELGLTAHIWERRPEKEAQHPGYRAWQCAQCNQWTSINMANPESAEIAETLDKGDQVPGQPECPGRMVAPAGDPDAAACVHCGQIRIEHKDGVCPGYATELFKAAPFEAPPLPEDVKLAEEAVRVTNNNIVDAKNAAKRKPRSSRKGRR